MKRYIRKNWWSFIEKKWKRSFAIFASIFLLAFNSVNVHSQGYNNIWCFGDSAGIDFSNVSNPVPIQTNLDTRGSCVSICDSAGQLLFYASTRSTYGIHSCQILNGAGDIIENGDSIIGEGWYNELIIIPFSDHSNRYYLFSLLVLSPYGLYYSVIDMNENGGAGKVIEKNVLFRSYPMWDALVAVKHANGGDWWLIAKRYDPQGTSDNEFLIYLIKQDTILETFQNIGANELAGAGNLTFSKAGDKILVTSRNGLIEVFDFDRCSGVFSNSKVIDQGNSKYSGASFSPNGDVIYVCTYRNMTTDFTHLLQFNLNAPNIYNSRDTIITLTHPIEAGGLLRLAPDDKIYWSCAWTNGINYIYPYQDTMYHTENMNLSVINDPDVIGSGCNFSLYSYYLGGKRTYWGLPNNPDYGLGPVVGSPCDTINTVVEPMEISSPALNLSYQSPGEIVIVQASKLKGTNVKIYLTDISGRILFVDQGKTTAGYFTKNIPMDNFAAGIYLVTIVTEKEKVSGKIVKE